MLVIVTFFITGVCSADKKVEPFNEKIEQVNKALRDLFQKTYKKNIMFHYHGNPGTGYAHNSVLTSNQKVVVYVLRYSYDLILKSLLKTKIQFYQGRDESIDAYAKELANMLKFIELRIGELDKELKHGKCLPISQHFGIVTIKN